jgi:hypothetical protein
VQIHKASFCYSVIALSCLSRTRYRLFPSVTKRKQCCAYSLSFPRPSRIDSDSFLGVGCVIRNRFRALSFCETHRQRKFILEYRDYTGWWEYIDYTEWWEYIDYTGWWEYIDYTGWWEYVDYTGWWEYRDYTGWWESLVSAFLSLFSLMSLFLRSYFSFFIPSLIKYLFRKCEYFLFFIHSFILFSVLLIFHASFFFCFLF